MCSPRVLVVDDESTIRHVLKQVLKSHDCEIREAPSAEEAISRVQGWEPHVVLLDIVLPGKNGLQLLSEIKHLSRDIEVLMMTSNTSAETALEAMRLGAYDYLQKPFDLQAIWITVQRALEKRTLTLKNRDLLLKQDQRNRELYSAVSLIDGRAAVCDDESVVEVVEYFLDVVCHELRAERASIMLVDSERDQLRLVASRGISEIDPRGVRVQIGEGIAGLVAQTGEPILVTDVKKNEKVKNVNPHCSDSFISAPIALSLAIKSDQAVMGVINLTNRSSGGNFNTADVTFLTGLAGQLAVALESAKRSDQLKRAYESLKAAQDQLVFSERIKAVGQMATGVAHDFNNVLSVILARTQFATQRLGAPSPDLVRVGTDLETVKKAALHGAEVIKRIQDYTRVRKDVPNRPVDLNAVVHEALEMARPKWKDWCEAEGREIELSMQLSEVPQVSGNVFELTQVVGNLIFNAVEAMPQGGRLSFRTWVNGDGVKMEVEDTGTGMDRQTRERLFEPFFSTKKNGQGLGTSIIYGILGRHRGEITVDSEPGRGTRFTVTLPVLCPGTPADPPCAEPADGGGAPARVLFVDDEKMVRETYEEALSLYGHQVTAVENADAALDRFGQDRFDVVITDLSMAGMSGLELAAEIKQRDAGMPVILFSGWAVQQNEDRIASAGIDEILVKPCLIEDLLHAVRRVTRSATATE
jgi:signal transduction histidine kinase/DNA-binding response OmpR family regulator